MIYGDSYSGIFYKPESLPISPSWANCSKIPVGDCILKKDSESGKLYIYFTPSTVSNLEQNLKVYCFEAFVPDETHPPIRNIHQGLLSNQISAVAEFPPYSENGLVDGCGQLFSIASDT